LIVDFEPLAAPEYTKNLFNLQFDLEDKFNRSIDLLEAVQIRNPYFRQDVEAHQRLIYGQ
jgi:predicted nucleotidyltransferase